MADTVSTVISKSAKAFTDSDMSSRKITHFLIVVDFLEVLFVDFFSK